MKKEIIEFLKPDKSRVLLSFFFPYILLIFGIAIGILFSKLSNATFVVPGMPHGVIPLLFSLINNLFISILLYPFVCSIVLLIDYSKKGEIKQVFNNRSFLIIVLTGILVFNPLSLHVISAFLYFLVWMPLHAPYQGGVEILEVIPNSPGEAIGFKPQDIVIEMKIIRDNKVIEDKKISNSNDFFEILNKTKSGDYLSFRKLGGDVRGHRIQENEIGNKNWGIKVRDVAQEK